MTIPQGNTLELAWNSVGELLEQRAEAFPDRPIIQFEGTTLSLAQLDRRVNRVAAALRSVGVARGERVGVMLANGLEFPTVWLALAKLGAVIVPLNTAYQHADLTHVLGDAGAVAVVGDAAVADRLAPVCESLGIAVRFATGTDVSGWTNLDELAAQQSGAFDAVDIGDHDLLNIQYTSGTTGFPKGCMLTHRYWLSIAALAGETLAADVDDVALTAQPFYYMDPQWNLVVALQAGARLVVLPRFSASTFWRDVKAHGVTYFYLLGTMPVYLLKQPPDEQVDRAHAVRMVLCSGIPPGLHAEIEDRWGVPWREVFGMTETGSDLMMPFDGTSVGTGAVGVPVRSKEARIVDANDEPIADGEQGELVIRGEPMMVGYWNNPEATAATIRDGWLHTGDLAYRDPTTGYFHISGRIKDTIRRSGENIAAVEVEAALAAHPAVEIAAIVPVPDELRGEEVKAYVVLRPGDSAKAVEPAELDEHCRLRLAPFKVPRYYAFVSDLPMTPSERVAKQTLVEGIEDLTLGAYDTQSHRWR